VTNNTACVRLRFIFCRHNVDRCVTTKRYSKSQKPEIECSKLLRQADVITD